jgi:heme-degrading monooxygenase HmoA
MNCACESEVRMVARTSTWSGSPEALDKCAEHVKTQVSGFVAGLPGNGGRASFINRDAGTAMTLTLWDSEEAAAETDKFADQSRRARSKRRELRSSTGGAYTAVAQL